MAEINIEIDFTGVENMIKDMMKAVEPAAIDKFLEDEAAPILRKDFEMQFATGGYPERWEPLAESTVAHKKAAGYPRRNRKGKPPKATMQNGAFGPQNILIQRGDLRISWTKDGLDHVCKAKNGELEIGSASPYAIYHQSEEPRKTGKGGKPKLPRRPLVINQDALSAVTEQAIKYVLGLKR